MGGPIIPRGLPSPRRAHSHLFPAKTPKTQGTAGTKISARHLGSCQGYSPPCFTATSEAGVTLHPRTIISNADDPVIPILQNTQTSREPTPLNFLGKVFLFLSFFENFYASLRQADDMLGSELSDALLRKGFNLGTCQVAARSTENAGPLAEPASLPPGDLNSREAAPPACPLESLTSAPQFPEPHNLRGSAVLTPQILLLRTRNPWGFTQPERPRGPRLPSGPRLPR